MENRNMLEGLFIAVVVWRGQSFIAGIRYKSGMEYYMTGFSTTGSAAYSFYRSSGDMKYHLIVKD